MTTVLLLIKNKIYFEVISNTKILLNEVANDQDFSKLTERNRQTWELDKGKDN